MFTISFNLKKKFLGFYAVIPTPNPNSNNPLLIFLIKVCLLSYIIMLNHGLSIISLLLMNIPLIEIIVLLFQSITMDYINLSQIIYLLTLHKQGIPLTVIIRDYIRQWLTNNIRNHLKNRIKEYLVIRFTPLMDCVKGYFSRWFSPLINYIMVYLNERFIPKIKKYHKAIIKITRDFSHKLSNLTYNIWPIRIFLDSIGIHFIIYSNFGDITFILGLIFCSISLILEVSTLIKYYSYIKDSKVVDLLVYTQILLLSGTFILFLYIFIPILLKKWLVLTAGWDKLKNYGPKAASGVSGPSGGGPSGGGPSGGGPSGGGPSGGGPSGIKRKRDEVKEFSSSELVESSAIPGLRVITRLSGDDSILHAEVGQPSGIPSRPTQAHHSSYEEYEIPDTSFGPRWGIYCRPDNHILASRVADPSDNKLLWSVDAITFRRAQVEYFNSDEWQKAKKQAAELDIIISTETLKSFIILNELSKNKKIDQSFANIMKKKLMLDRLVREYAKKYPYTSQEWETRTEWLSRIQMAHWLKYKIRIINSDGKPKEGYNDIINSMHVDALSTMVSPRCYDPTIAVRITEYESSLKQARSTVNKYTPKRTYINFPEK